MHHFCQLSLKGFDALIRWFFRCIDMKMARYDRTAEETKCFFTFLTANIEMQIYLVIVCTSMLLKVGSLGMRFNENHA